MMRNLLAVLLLGATACIPPAPTQLAPSAAHVTLTPSAAVQRSAALLTAQGFTLAVSDATAGILTATRTLKRSAQQGAVTCRWANGSIADTWGQVALTISLTARTDSVQLASRAHVEFPGMPLSTPPSDDDCASTGMVETQLLTALGAK